MTMTMTIKNRDTLENEISHNNHSKTRIQLIQTEILLDIRDILIEIKESLIDIETAVEKSRVKI